MGRVLKWRREGPRQEPWGPAATGTGQKGPVHGDGRRMRGGECHRNQDKKLGRQGKVESSSAAYLGAKIGAWGIRICVTGKAGFSLIIQIKSQH